MGSTSVPLAAALLLSCATAGRDSPASVLEGRAACAGDLCASGADDLEQGELLFEQVGQDAASVAGHLSEVSDRSGDLGSDPKAKTVMIVRRRRVVTSLRGKRRRTALRSAGLKPPKTRPRRRSPKTA